MSHVDGRYHAERVAWGKNVLAARGAWGVCVKGGNVDMVTEVWRGCCEMDGTSRLVGGGGELMLDPEDLQPT